MVSKPGSKPDRLRAKILGELRRDPVDLIALVQALEDLTVLAKRPWWKRLRGL